MLKIPGSQNFGQSGCGCCTGGGFGLNGMNGLGQMNGLNSFGGSDPLNGMMNGMLMMSMMAMMTQMLQMLTGGNGVSGGAGQFGPGQSASGLTDFLGGAAPSASPNSGGSSSGTAGTPASTGGSTGASSGGTVDPSTVKDKTSTSGLSEAAKAGLAEAHKFGLPLVSGKRSGSGTSDHNHGDAIDVSTLPIGAASSNGGTQQMKEYAEHMRQQGKAGKMKVKYVILDGKIASSRDNWNWRPYTYPGKTQAQLDALKKSNPGEYNRIQHYDHVHVSFH